jgi:hypothetical protein
MADRSPFQFKFMVVEEWNNWQLPGESKASNPTTAQHFPYTEPFNAECRAYGRLIETGHEDLALKCFGYVLLDPQHEQALFAKFRYRINMFVYDDHNSQSQRPALQTRSGGLAPIRGIIKELGTPVRWYTIPEGTDDGSWDIRVKHVKRIIRDVGGLHQLGIMDLDMDMKQIINYRLADFSTAITIPHPRTTMELRPDLAGRGDHGEKEALMHADVFKVCRADYIMTDEMVGEYNTSLLVPGAKAPRKLEVRAIPRIEFDRASRLYTSARYGLRRQQRAYTPVDPRGFDWKAAAGQAAARKRLRIQKRPTKFWFFDPAWARFRIEQETHSQTLSRQRHEEEREDPIAYYFPHLAC